MRSNVLFKFLVPALLLGVLLIVVVFQPSKPSAPEPMDADLVLTPEEARELGIEGDTPEDTLRTLVGELRHMRGQINSANQRNEQLADQNKSLEERSRDWEKQLDQALSRAQSEVANTKAETQQMTDRLMGMMDELESRVTSGSSDFGDIPIGLGLGSGADAPPAGGVVWIEPSDAQELDHQGRPVSSGLGFANPFNNPLEGSVVDRQQRDGLNALGERERGKINRNDEVEPVYTIAENSTLLGSMTMTALIGRVPVDGIVSDPYPFKVLIGKDNLAANGFELPEVRGAVMSGTSQGDWTLSCVRGQVETITFIFEDGTIRTVPEPEAVLRNRSTSSTNNARGSITGGIGYISDPYGIPCIAGDRKSNAREYIGNNSLITAAGAAIALGFGDDDSTTVNSGGSTITETNQAFNEILTRGVNDVQDWINKLYGQAFAAVYVPPHQQVAVHIDRELQIDFEKFGRKVRHNEQINETVWLD